jgi:hypothetical protein
VPLDPLDPVLAGDEQLVVRGSLEVEEADLLALLAGAQVLVDGSPVRENGVHLLARLDEAGRADAGQLAGGLGGVLGGEPGVEAHERGGEALAQEDVLGRAALRVEDLGCDVLVAELLEERDRGVFGEGGFVPVAAVRRAHAAALPEVSGRTRISPVRSDDNMVRLRAI